MAKPQTTPPLYNDVMQLKMSDLKRWGYLKENVNLTTSVTWSRKDFYGQWFERGKIGITINLSTHRPYVVLDYSWNGEAKQYVVFLQSRDSNLRKGKIWFFVCPKTGKLSRKLYCVQGMFLHREAFTGCMYETQTRSKKWRDMDSLYGACFAVEHCYNEIYRKHFKKHYGGKITKRYAKLKSIIDKGERVPTEDIERLI